MTQDADERDIWVDVVSHEPVDPEHAKYQSFFNGHLYHFNDLVNKQTFDQDPMLWVSTPHASETSASVAPTESE